MLRHRLDPILCVSKRYATAQAAVKAATCQLELIAAGLPPRLTTRDNPAPALREAPADRACRSSSAKTGTHQR